MTNLLLLAAEEHTGFTHFFISEGEHSGVEVLISASAAIILFALLWWKGLPAAKDMAEGRTDRIAKEVTEAEKARRDAEGRLGEVQSRIANAENERQRILVEARQTAEALKQQIAGRAADEAEAVKTRAAADIESSKQQAIADLNAAVAALALGAAEAVIEANLDATTQTDLIDGYIQHVGA
jgi:F-type H+-transporting ATPase subunit b